MKNTPEFKTHLSILAVIIFSLTIYGCQKKGSLKNMTTKVENPDKVTSNSTPKTIEGDSASVKKEAESEATADASTKEVPKKEETKSSPSSNGNSKIGNRNANENKITTALERIARNMENLNLVYDSSLKQDCSGIYHQIKDSIQVRIPPLADNSQYEYPLIRDIRSSRQIANWYHSKNNLLIVQDAMAERNKIRPGSVMFFGKPDKKYSNIDIDLLTNRENGFTSQGAIMHIAVVTSVEKDAQGNVTAYTIMHGRNKRHPASRSGSKAEQSKNTKGLPPFGNWSQQWVAMANIETAI